MGNVWVRAFVDGDEQAIADIYNQAIIQGGMTFDDRPFGVKDIRALIGHFNERETVLVAARDDDVLGWGIIKQYSNRLGYRVCCETSIYLALAETGKGYGSILQEQLLQKVVELGYHHVVTKIVASNQGSIKFHQRFGFEVVGIQKEIGYLRGRWHDVVIMQLILPQVPPYRPDLA